MVTFFCSSCGEYLKKKQAEQHVDYCNDKLSCNDCKKVMVGFNLIKAHIKCETVQPIKTPNMKNVKVDDMEWLGFKKTLRAIVKRADGRRINRDALNKLVKEVIKQNNEEMPDNFEVVFKTKLASSKNLKSEGFHVRYERN